MTVDEAVRTLKSLTRPSTDLERDLALSVVTYQLARLLAIDASSSHFPRPTTVAGLAADIKAGLDAQP